MRKKSDGIELPDGQVYDIIPPLPTSSERGGIVAKDKTTETLEVAVDPNTGKAYVESVDISGKADKSYVDNAVATKQDILTQTDKKAIANIYGQLEEGTVNLINPFTIQNNTLVGSNGVITHNSTYRFNTYTDIKVKPETTYMLQKKVADSFKVYIGYYKEDGTFISRPYFTTTRRFSFTTPPLTDHIAFSYEFKNSAGTEFYDFSELMLSENDTEQDYKSYYKIANGFNQEFDKNRFSFSAFKKFAVIGDSLSVGYNWDSDTSQSSERNIPYSWGQALARLYGNECVNMGFSGADTEDWFTNPNYGYVDLVKEGNKCQAYLIGLGVNDSVTAETKEAFKTRYQQVITAVKTVNADAKIFCFTMTASTNKDIKNQAIKEVVAVNTNTYLVDIDGEYKDVFDAQIIRDYMLGNHYTAGGYVNIGMINGWIISEIMDKHADEFWNIFKIPYDASPNPITDVQINGTSITNDGVANIPKASATKLGVIKVDSGYGIARNPDYDFIYPVTASTSSTNNEVRAGSTSWRVIAPSNQDASAFYGLAKASGDSTQSASANAVGNYTDTAKQKIQEMLGIVTLTQTEYDALVTKSPSTIYIITED